MNSHLCRLRLPALLAVGFVLAFSGHVRSETSQKGVIGKGKAWETPFFVRDTGVEGPAVMVVGGMHGNEPAGAVAAEQLRHWPLVKGRLVVVPRANVLGLAENTRYIPGAPESRRDLNRNFPGDDLADGTRGEIAAALWKLVRDHDPDWVFDLHEGHHFNRSHQPKEGKSKSVGSSVLHYPSEQIDPLAKRMQAAANATVTDPDRKFTLPSRGTKKTGLVNAAVTLLDKQGMILETTFNYQRLPIRTKQHRAMMSVALRHVGLIDRDCVDLVAPPASDDLIPVALFDGEGSTDKGIGNTKRALAADPRFFVVQLGPEDIRPEILSQFRAVIFSGGSGSRQARSIGEAGAAAVRAYVEDGGGYLGICAGAYLCSAHYDWSLDLVDTSVFTGAREIEGVGTKQMWYRGKSSSVKMELTDAGRERFPNLPETVVDVTYQNGPIVWPKNDPDIEDYRVLAYFRSEKVLYPPQEGTMVDSPAILEGNFGEGRVIAVSPHPEATEGLESIIELAVRAIVENDDPAP